MPLPFLLWFFRSCPAVPAAAYHHDVFADMGLHQAALDQLAIVVEELGTARYGGFL